jgi:L-Lysine epsilon oxidase N-terminal/L-lysine epsilon oxidase C-terminal domain
MKLAMTEYEIHPAIGIACVGSSLLTSDEGFFPGPEPGGSPPANYRDCAGNLKRQAARFRVFACRRDENRKLMEAAELTLNAAHSITWTVHLVNRKGTARRQYQSGPGFRNGPTQDEVGDRELVIDPGPRTVRTPGDRGVFDTGRFRSTTVPLGEIVMEPTGRLPVLGGFGRSGSDPQQPRLNSANGHRTDNRNWFDDVSDGSASVRIELHNGTIAESSAWVIVGPPDFAPGIKNFVTLYDAILDVGVRRGLLPAPTDPPNQLSFTRHVRLILASALGYRFVNRFTYHGTVEDRVYEQEPDRKGDFSRFWEGLADPSPASSELRAVLIDRLRNPDPRAPRAELHPLALMPRLRNNRRGRTGADDVLPLTATQYKIMRAWADGDFVNYLGKPQTDDELLPDALTRMALESCVGGALDPGIEVSPAVLFDGARYLDGEPFRLSHAAVRPGEVTQYNAAPWQADFLTCRWEELDGPWPRRLGWWPAQRPDDVYPRLGAAVMLPSIRGLDEDYQDMIDRWDRLGVVVDRG